MKSKTLYSTGLFLLCLFTVIHVSAQDTIKSLPPVIVKATTTKVPGRIWKGFSTYFNNAEIPMWYRLNKDYLVKFMIYDEQNRALFSKKGRLIYHISYGYEKSLPDNIKGQVKENYPGHGITRAIKVVEAGREIWVINLEDAEALIIVRVEDGELEEVQIIKKTT